MMFKDEIRKTIILHGNLVKIFSSGRYHKGYCLFKQLTKKLEKYYDIYEEKEIGFNPFSSYYVWLICLEKIKNIEHIVHKNKKYHKIFEKFRGETGCFELIVRKECENESVWNFKENCGNNAKKP